MAEPVDELERPASAPREEESLFARGDDDLLVRQERATREQFSETVTVIIDGTTVIVPRATPLTDALGNVRRGPDGLPIPRATTIYDAAAQIVRAGEWPSDDLGRRIPVLCHAEHLDPVAVCRMCSVHISIMKRGALTPGRKLVPACQHRVEENMIVTTRVGPPNPDGEVGRFVAQVNNSTKMLAELLTADHVHPHPVRDNRFKNELTAVATLVGGTESRFHGQNAGGPGGRNFQHNAKTRPVALPVIAGSATDLPYSSRSIQVDHDRCILCDRCVRSCSDVKPFKVIGHTGKGYTTRISFDLDEVMNESSCVQCGECMTSCPTGALTLNRRVSPKSWPDAPAIPTDPAEPLPAGFLSADAMLEVALPYQTEAGEPTTFAPFQGVPFAYLRWNEGAVRKRDVRAGDVLCHEGEFGSTAFLLVDGQFEVWVTTTAAAERGTLIGRLLGGGRAAPARDVMVATMAASRDLILGEMACLTNTARTATIKAATDGRVYEVTRNMLTMVQRNRTGRDILASIYRGRAIASSLRRGRLFAGLSAEQRETVLRELQPVSGLATVEPGETIVRQGDAIGLDERGGFRGDFYIVRLGSVKVARTVGGREQVLARLGPDDYFGEIALLADDPRVAPLMPPGSDNRRRTATVSALDDVEIVRIPGDEFRRVCRTYPEIGDRLALGCATSLATHRHPPKLQHDLLGTFLDQGFFQGQKMLILDLERCTRCDECTRACADAHGDGHSRLLREGPRFGKFLVATSCRSCHTPYCMEGCPVDAIHRGANSLAVQIDSHCIGCGLCAKNCPYDSIQMTARDDSVGVKMIAAVEKKAVNCDLCHDLVPAGADPFCVSACPHDAAFRWDADRLLKTAIG